MPTIAHASKASKKEKRRERAGASPRPSVDEPAAERRGGGTIAALRALLGGNADALAALERIEADIDRAQDVLGRSLTRLTGALEPTILMLVADLDDPTLDDAREVARTVVAARLDVYEALADLADVKGGAA
jgi:hypothetical protein